MRARGQEYDRFKARRALANKRAAPGGARAKAAPRALDGQGLAEVQVRMGGKWPLSRQELCSSCHSCQA